MPEVDGLRSIAGTDSQTLTVSKGDFGRILGTQLSDCLLPGPDVRNSRATVSSWSIGIPETFNGLQLPFGFPNPEIKRNMVDQHIAYETDPADQGNVRPIQANKEAQCEIGRAHV